MTHRSRGNRPESASTANARRSDSSQFDDSGGDSRRTVITHSEQAAPRTAQVSQSMITVATFRTPGFEVPVAVPNKIRPDVPAVSAP